MDAADTPSVRSSRGADAVAGVVATAVALGGTELLAGLLPRAASPVLAVGDAVVDIVPAWLKNAAIAVFGQSDKTALLIGMFVVFALVGAGLGALARRRFAVAAGTFVLVGVVGVAAAAGDPRASVAISGLAIAGGVGAGLVFLRWLLRQAPDRSSAGMSRRRFLRLAAVGGLAALTAAGSGRWLRGRSVAAASRNELVLPNPAATAPALAGGNDLGVPGMDPFVTPNRDFYRIDTALSVPRVDVKTWRLAVTGMVDRPLDLSFDDLVDLGLEERWVTLCCVSNEVGGDLVGNAKWSGVRLRDVLELAGAQVAATQIVGRSVDGWTAGFPTSVALDGRNALVAVAMNGEPLPLEHGFPARLVVPGLYGYVSATKWLSEIELTTWEAFDAYWVPRGWSKEGPIKTQSRIDVPQLGAVDAGRVAVAGVAWAQQRGISKVEVQVDDGAWSEARLATVPNVDTWRQWSWDWDATPGDHVLQVRATDSDGQTQVAQRRPVMPDGATGYHRISVQVRNP